MSTLNTQPKEEPVVDQALLAKQIDLITSSTQKLLGSGLNFNAVVVLVHDDTGLPKREIIAILRSLGDLKKKYTTLS